MISLNFHTVATTQFPDTTTGTGSAMTVIAIGTDKAVAFLTQTGADDNVHYFSADLDNLIVSRTLDTGQPVVTGMGFNPVTQKIWCGNTTTQRDRIFAFDPTTHTITNDFTVPTSNLANPQGFGTNGLIFMRSYHNVLATTLEIFDMAGTFLGDREIPDVRVSGISQAALGWVMCDHANHLMAVFGALGSVIATAPCPGPASLVEAIAYGNPLEFADVIAILVNTGALVAPIQPGDPWPGPGPQPWLLPHLIYVANNASQTIYAGYLTP